MSSKELFDKNVDCHVCKGEGKVNGSKCTECGGKGVYSMFKYSCAYDYTDKIDEKIYPQTDTFIEQKNEQ